MTMQGVGSGAAIAIPQTQAAQPRPAPVEAPPLVAPVAAAPDRSPWAPPPGAAPGMEPQAGPPQMPPPAPAAAPPPQPQPQPQPQAPDVAPAPASSTGSRKKVKEEEKAAKGRFRETMWFKKGDLDAEAAAKAAADRAKSGRDTGNEQADSLPIDERYKDDGSISRGDKEKYSLRTGGTEMMPALRDGPAQSSDKVSEDELIGEMKSGRGKILALIGVAVIALIVIVVLVAR
jgi:hypothetical protein